MGITMFKAANLANLGELSRNINEAIKALAVIQSWLKLCEQTKT